MSQPTGLELQPQPTPKDPLRSIGPIITAQIFPPAESGRTTQTRERQGADVSSVYPVEEDLRFIQDYGNGKTPMTEPQMEYYLTENIKGFLGEFAGRIPYKQIKGLVLKDELQVGGFDMLHAAEKAVLIKQQHGLDASREIAELEGLKIIHSQLGKDGKKGMVWFSASKDANYRMIYIFEAGERDDQLGGVPFTETIITRPEDIGQIDKSKEDYLHAAQISDKLVATPQKAEDMLNQPLGLDNLSQVGSIFELTGIDPKEIAWSKEYERRVMMSVGPYISQYIDLVKQYRNHSMYDADFKRQAQPLIDKIYTIGVQVKNYLEAKDLKRPKLPIDEAIAKRMGGDGGSTRDADISPLDFVYPHMPAKIVGGSLCPSWMTNTASATSMSAFINAGYPVSEAMALASRASKTGEIIIKGDRYLLCYCPKDGCPSSKKSPREKVLAKIKDNKITCPCCGKSAHYNC